MNGLLRIIGLSDYQTYRQEGNYYNWAWGTVPNPCSDTRLYSFFKDGINPGGALTVSTFTLRDITLKGGVKTVNSSFALNTGLINWDRGTYTDTFYFTATAKITLTDVDHGLKEFYIKLSDDSEYISEPFMYNGECDEYTTLGDYDTSDYDLTDYYV